MDTHIKVFGLPPLPHSLEALQLVQEHIHSSRRSQTFLKGTVGQNATIRPELVGKKSSLTRPLFEAASFS